jgi:hypothetical protein
MRKNADEATDGSPSLLACVRACLRACVLPSLPCLLPALPIVSLVYCVQLSGKLKRRDSPTLSEEAMVCHCLEMCRYT